MENVRITDPTACVHCGKCKQNCVFLSKYNIDIGDTEKLKDLAYHCFLCGRCTEVCPVGIDGRQIILDYRRERVQQNQDRLKEKGYGLLMFEKNNYIYRNYHDATSGSVLFPGCNFPSFYPETMKKLSRLLKEKAGIGTVFDCCGKPIAELGLEKREQDIIAGIDRRLRDAKVEEVVMVCPNCYHFLKPHLSMKVVSIYEKLRELGLGEKIEESLQVFPPCPEREDGEQELLEDIRFFLKQEPTLLTCAQCCGLGGCAPVREPELAGNVTDEIPKDTSLTTYCGTCAGSFARKGYEDVNHILVKILGSEEKPDTKSSMINRMKTKFWRG